LIEGIITPKVPKVKRDGRHRIGESQLYQELALFVKDKVHSRWGLNPNLQPIAYKADSGSYKLQHLLHKSIFGKME
jgi:hypothetical protein